MVLSLFWSLFKTVLTTVGMWCIFRKFGRKGWYALIPFIRFYKLSECVGKEKEGRSFMVFYGLSHVLQLMITFTADSSDTAKNSLMYNALLILAIINAVPYIIYNIRIFIGICEAFGKRRRWLWIWIFLEWFGYAVYGLNKKFRPKEEFILKPGEEGAQLSGILVSGDGSGLSVNIKQRSVRGFFSKFTLLRDIHLTVPTGHMVLLLGGSGAGKTTFLNAVTGYEKADADIELGRYNVYRDYDLMKYDIGFVPQQDLMRGNDTVCRTVTDAASLRLPSSIRGKERKQRIEDVLDAFGLSPVRNSLVSKLSGGQRKRLSIAMEYISYPTLFILDEPDSGLDGVVARGLFEKLRAIADSGKIVMVITHTPDRVIDLFDDVIVLAKDSARTGRLAYYGAVDEAYRFFGRSSMEEILLSINQKEEGGEGRAEEFVTKYASQVSAGGNA